VHESQITLAEGRADLKSELVHLNDREADHISDGDRGEAVGLGDHDVLHGDLLLSPWPETFQGLQIQAVGPVNGDRSCRSESVRMMTTVTDLSHHGPSSTPVSSDGRVHLSTRTLDGVKYFRALADEAWQISRCQRG
jgi:hypothetical protein